MRFDLEKSLLMFKFNQFLPANTCFNIEITMIKMGTSFISIKSTCAAKISIFEEDSFVVTYVTLNVRPSIKSIARLTIWQIAIFCAHPGLKFLVTIRAYFRKQLTSN
jgi:hypothetical protein